MSLSFHILRKDLRRLKWALLMWYALIGIRCLIMGAGVDVHLDTPTLRTLDWLLTALRGLEAIALFPIVSLLIHGDSVVGTTSFWLTRPISRFNLLASKMLFIVVLLLLPMVIGEIAVLLANRVTVADAVLCALEVLEGRLVILSLITALAATSPGFPTTVLAGVVLIAVSLLGWYTSVFASSLYGSWPHPVSLRQSAAFVQSVAVIAICIVAVSAQFLTRRTNRSRAVLFSGVLLAATGSVFWPFDFMRQTKTEVGLTNFNPGVVRVQLEDGPVYSPFGHRLAPKQLGYVAGRVRVSGLEPGFLVRPVWVESSLQFKDGTTLAHRPSRYRKQVLNRTASGPEAQAWRDAVQFVLGDVRLLNPEDVRSYEQLPKLVELIESQYRQYKDHPGVLSAELEAIALRLEVSASMPLVEGAVFDQGSFHISVLDVVLESGNVVVTLRESSPLSSFVERDLDWDFWVLRNEHRGQAVVGKFVNSSWWFGGSFSLTGSPLNLVHWRFTFPTSPEAGTIAERIVDEQWLKEANLLLLDEVELGTFKKSFVVEDFLMGR